MQNIAIVILAAGQGSRMGVAKQVLDFEGEPLVRHCARQALAANPSRLIVVVGAHAAAVRLALEGLPVEVVENPDWDSGIGSSIRKGVRAVALGQEPALILTLADQPALRAESFKRLESVWRETGKSIVSSSYAETYGVPVLFARERFRDLDGLKPTAGCKGLIERRLEETEMVEMPEASLDVDTPADYERLKRVGVGEGALSAKP